MTLYLLANFGGPRNIEEIAPFLQALLTDKDVIRTGMPDLLHDWFFSRVAKKRAKKIQIDYDLIGGKSPIYEDTEAVAELLSKQLQAPVCSFHRYLPATHRAFLEKVLESNCQEIRVFPMFPQFSYATTGSIARWFGNQFPPQVIEKMRWVKSYAGHPAFVRSYQRIIREFLINAGLAEKETVLLFSAHGVPKKYIEQGDIYEQECRLSFEKIASAFPEALSRLAYQSKFGRGEWLRPYTPDVCEGIRSWNEGRENVVFIPLAFTSDHIETLFEIEYQYLPLILKKGLKAYRCPALNRRQEWISAIVEILSNSDEFSNGVLIRKR